MWTVTMVSLSLSVPLNASPHERVDFYFQCYVRLHLPLAMTLHCIKKSEKNINESLDRNCHYSDWFESEIQSVVRKPGFLVRNFVQNF